MANMINAKIDVSHLKSKINDLSKLRDQAMPLIYDEFVQVTPIHTGNARVKTSYHANVITADYPYASVLNDGRGYRDGQMRGSEQAPDGMVQPTIEFAKQLIPQLIQKMGKR
jgi:hypothetical protein